MIPKGGLLLCLLVGLLVVLPTGYALAIDEWDSPTTDDDTANATNNVLIPGDPPQRHDVQAIGGVADEDWYRLVVVAGHSYVVRVGARQDPCFDFFAGGTTNAFEVFESDATTLITQGDDYPGTGTISTYWARFVAPSTGNAPVFVRLAGSTSCTSTSDYTIQVWDTTLVSPRWSTFAGFFTSYGFLNTHRGTINGTLTLVDGGGTTVATQNFTIAVGRVAFTDTNQIGVAANNAGRAFFTHNGPVGGIVADGFIQNFNVSPPVIQPVKFERGLKGD